MNLINCSFDAISLSKKSLITPLSGANFHSLNLFLSDKDLYFVLSLICKDTKSSY